MKPQKMKLIAAMVSLACSFSAHAVLERVGPPNLAPSIGGYPAWYQDTSGLALEFCDPKNQAEADGGWCLLLAGDLAQVPEAFPGAFFDEHFYFAADATIPLATGSAASLVLAEEAAFGGAGAPVPGQQITFSRIRVKIGNVPVSGTYRFIHPYGEEVLEGVAGDRIFFTDDVGFGCAQGQFDCALNSRLGPFLLPSLTPGGAELPPVTGPVPGKLYIADPVSKGPVTGSTLPNFVDSTGALRNHNIFRVEGPAGSNIGGPGIDFVETTEFSLMGRVFTGTMAGRLDVDRASYTRDVTGLKLDVFANAFPTTQGRAPAQARPVAVAPQLTYFDAPCGGTIDAQGSVQPPFTAPVGATETQMFSAGGLQWGQSQPAVLPTTVCIKDGTARNAAGQIVPAFVPRQVTDEVTITGAAYDPTIGTLTVTATSSDALVPPTLSLAYGTFRGDMVGGQIVVPGITAPPSSVRVLSSAAGGNEYEVSIGASAGAPAPVGVPVALNDAFAFLEDSGTQTLGVLANDGNVLGGTVSLISLPRLGSTVVNLDGSVSYTPNLNASGLDAFTYRVAVGTQVSNIGNVTLNVVPVNDPPVAVNDTVNGIVNVPASIKVLANDTDPDGTADIVAAVNVTSPLPAGATATVTGGVVDFLATLPGTYTFTYQAQDASLAPSANTGTVTVQVAAAETIGLKSAGYVLRQNRIRVVGSISPAANQVITIEYVNSAGVVLGTAGTVTPLPDGTWALDSVGVPVPPAGTTAVKASTPNGTVSAIALKIG